MGQKDNLFASGGDDKRVFVWTVHHLKTQGKPYKTLRGQQSPVSCLTFDSCEEQIATGSTTGVVTLWDISSPKDPKIFTSSHSSAITAISISPDSVFLATGARDGSVKIWNIVQKTCLFTIPQHKDQINDLKFSPDSSTLFTASEDGTCAILNVYEGTESGVLDAEEPIRVIGVHPDDYVIATGCSSGKAIVWDLESHEIINTMIPALSPVRSLHFLGNGTMFVISTSANTSFWKWEGTGDDDTPHMYDSEPTNFQSIANNAFDCAVGDDLLKFVLVKNHSVSLHLCNLKNMSPWNRSASKQKPDTQKPKQAVQKPVEQSPKEDTPAKSPTRPIPQQNKIYGLSADSPFAPADENPPEKAFTPSRGARPADSADAHTETPKQNASRPIDTPLSSTRLLKSKLGMSLRDPWAVNGVVDMRGEEAEEETVSTIDDKADEKEEKKQSDKHSPPSKEKKEEGGLLSLFQKKSGGTPVPTLSDEEALASIGADHSGILSVLTERKGNEAIVKSLWPKGIVPMCKGLAGMDDDAVTNDIMLQMQNIPSVFTLEACVHLLPRLIKMLDSPIESYQHSSVSQILLFANSFGPVIKRTRLAPSSIGVDLALDQRRERCTIANSLFIQAGVKLKTISAKRSSPTDLLGMRAKECKKMIDSFADYS
ncbi:putative katanin regulatory subunit B1 S homeolog [Blattamonas nauphoetae]|uniref:Katanin regulatory subunit B1 S homeolog n=1 Tax=Blattamonas nauphoetae TaxID=2049346 RepID=A0ABQ9XRZ8_9EUKA|nr:putative katanin regulatory subunit B1 S homeolog [Blattamonas nauphoetae]